MEIIVKLIMVLSIFVSCNMKEKGKNINNPISINDSCSTLRMHEFMERQYKIKKVLAEGDTLLYNELRNYYIDNAELIEFLGISLIMANKFDYTLAYHDVAYALLGGNPKFGKKNPNAYDSATRKMFNDYLNVALERNCPGANRLIEWYEEE